MITNLRVEFVPADEKSGNQIVKFDGEFDKAGYSEVRPGLEKFIESFAAKNLIFDFHNLKFINSEGIGFLMEVHAHLAKRGQKLVLIGPNAHVRDIFKAIGVAEIISIHDELNDFLSKQ